MLLSHSKARPAKAGLFKPEWTATSCACLSIGHSWSILFFSLSLFLCSRMFFLSLTRLQYSACEDREYSFPLTRGSYCYRAAWQGYSNKWTAITILDLQNIYWFILHSINSFSFNANSTYNLYPQASYALHFINFPHSPFIKYYWEFIIRVYVKC